MGGEVTQAFLRSVTSLADKTEKVGGGVRDSSRDCPRAKTWSAGNSLWQSGHWTDIVSAVLCLEMWLHLSEPSLYHPQSEQIDVCRVQTSKPTPVIQHVDMKAEESGMEGQSQRRGEFKVRVGYVRSFLKKKKKLRFL